MHNSARPKGHPDRTERRMPCIHRLTGAHSAARRPSRTHQATAGKGLPALLPPTTRGCTSPHAPNRNRFNAHRLGSHDPLEMSDILKDLSLLLHPVGIGWLALIASAILCLRRRRALGTFVCSLAALALWILAQPPLVLPVYGTLEEPWIHSTVEQAPNADAIIVLGGGWRTSVHDFRRVDFMESMDRFFTGCELGRLGKAPVLVLGGDPVTHGTNQPPDSEGLHRWLQDWGLASLEVVSLGPVKTTRDEALAAGELVRKRGWKKVLLVTSAFHMRRALATFTKEAVPVHPVACDFKFLRGDETTQKWHWAPSEEDLFQLGLWWHEQVGWFVYRLLGRA